MLTEFQRRKIARLFAMYDANKDGVIQKQDLHRVFLGLMNARGLTPDSPEFGSFETRWMSRWTKMREAADVNRDNLVTLNEYFDYFDRSLNAEGGYETQVRSIGDLAFMVSDRDGDGVITLDEFRGFYRAIGLDGSFADDLYRRLQLTPDSRMSKDANLELIRQFFTSEDPQAAGNWFMGPF